MFDHILDLHFNEKNGTGYWLDVLKKTGLSRADFQSTEDLYKLGSMDVHALRTRKITDFIPASLHQRMGEMVLSETGGTTGDPCRRVFLPEEFHNAFVAPWLDAVERFGFPKEERWLFVGPSGPHIISQAARALAREMNSLEPFSIDCDVRWIKQQQPDSMGFMLYMEHVFNQALNIINQQDISVLFTTPPLLLGLAQRMSVKQRQQIRGVHTGGMAQDPQTSKKLAELFSSAVILPGYGNSLFGATFEREQHVNTPSAFFVHDPALHVNLIPLPKTEEEKPRLTETVDIGQRGRVMFHRFDRAFLLINMLERDTAIRGMVNGQQSLSDIQGLKFVEKESAGVY
jgi:phenylacetate-coenzyme A ligase PaaK-like adenylate-forming protein